MRRAAFFLVPFLIAACGQDPVEPRASGPTPPEAPEPARIVDVVAERDALDAPVRLRWKTEPTGAPVDLLVASVPGAAVEEMELLADDLAQGSFMAEVSGRRYFALRTGEGVVARTAVRILPLAGGRNFRDIGGYETADGRRVKWGMVYRSGTMVGLTKDDYGYLDDLDAKVLVDFRSSEERAEEPTTWTVDTPEYWARDYSMAMNASGLRELFTGGEVSAARTRKVMTEQYYEMALQQREAYRLMFDRLAAGETPLVFNCSAGKDRTGVAAALLLTALGVPREQVVADYAMSDDIVDYSAAFLEAGEAQGGEDSPYAFLRQLPRDAIMPLLASEPAYVEAALDGLVEEYGSVLAFLRTELDVTDAELAAIRSQLLEG